MSGLLLKDFYMMKKYCRAHLIIIVCFTIAALWKVGGEQMSMFFLMYPCVMTSMIPITLLAYDERERWHLYSAVLPYSRAQIVSGKYLVSLICQFVVIVILAAAHMVGGLVSGEFHLIDFLATMTTLMIVSCAGPALVLPFSFKLGVEKGRIAYFIMLVVFLGGGYAFAESFGRTLNMVNIDASLIVTGICIGTVVLYILSWLLAIAFYNRREL